MGKFKATLVKIKRSAYIVLALSLATTGLVQGIFLPKAHAFPVGGQVQSRSIKISDSRPNITGVTYDVKYTAATTGTVRGIIIDFCDSTSTPIIGDSTCNVTNLGGFTVGASPTVTLVSGITATWTASSLNSGRTLKLVKAGGDSMTAASTVVEFTINAVHNPNFTGTFYARVITYSSNTGDIATYAPGTEGSSDATDYGGFALSTANVITITAKVQESMTFCVSGQAPGPSCGATGLPVTAPNLIIGHGGNLILDSSVVDSSTAYTQLSTNANGGAILRMRNTAASGGLNSGTNFIPAANAGANTPAAFTAGAANFGVFVSNGTGGTGTISADSNYNDGTSTHYGMDTTTAAGANVLGTYGDVIAASTAPVNSVQNDLTFAATASNTTPAGIYTANIIIIATGTF
ncbi:MAG TPA: hypothetical protein VLF43_05175 [Candidatus Saccharimonadales bacterium]|nr:hypothetical protein [Candidatus Saccharimonadales bacterium]